MSANAFRLKFFFLMYFWVRWTMVLVFSCYCRYRCGPHGQPAGLIRLSGHLLPLASYLGPWGGGGQVLGATLLDWIKDYLTETGNGREVTMGFSFLQTRRNLMSANLLLYAGNPVLLRSMLIPVHEEQSCVCHCRYPLQNKGNILHLHLELDTIQGNWDATMEKLKCTSCTFCTRLCS